MRFLPLIILSFLVLNCVTWDPHCGWCKSKKCWLCWLKGQCEPRTFTRGGGFGSRMGFMPGFGLGSMFGNMFGFGPGLGYYAASAIGNAARGFANSGSSYRGAAGGPGYRRSDGAEGRSNYQSHADRTRGNINTMKRAQKPALPAWT